jgi:hypothetical protein
MFYHPFSHPRMSSFGNLSSPLLPTSCALPNFKLPPTLPNGSILTVQSGGHLHFPRLPFPVPFWSTPDSASSHSLLAISPFLQASGFCLLTPTTLSTFAPGDPTPVLVGSKRASENVWRLHIPHTHPFTPLIPCTFSLPLHHL